MKQGRWILETAGLALLLAIGIASILVDARIGFPALVALLLGTGS